MAKQNKKKINVLKVKKERKPRKDPRVETVYEEMVEFTCPVRGKVKQLVKIRRYKSLNEQNRHTIPSNESIDKLEENDDGLSIYSEGEELGITETETE